MSGAINGRPGRLPAFCAAAPQHPSTSVLSALPRDLLRGAPWVEVQRDRPRGSCVIFCAGAYGSRASRLQRRAALVGYGWGLACSTHPLLLFLGLLCCQRPRARLQSAPRATGMGPGRTGRPQDGAGSRGRRAARLRRNQPEPRRTSPRTSADGRRNFGGRRTLGAGRREELLDAMQPFEYRSVRYWSKEINGTLTGGRKK